MMNFLIQTIDNNVVHDFSFTLLRSLEFYDQFREEKIPYSFCEKHLLRKSQVKKVPVGTVEFVTNYMVLHGLPKPKPINIPDCLLSHSPANPFNGTRNDIEGKKFVKSNDQVKGLEAGIYTSEDLPEGNYQISNPINIHSEYRCFVYMDRLVGIKHYSGDFTMFPDVSSIKHFIDKYTDESPVAYTLDIGIADEGITFPIEVHDFYSCGFYGFSDYNIIPHMFNRWYRQYEQQVANV